MILLPSFRKRAALQDSGVYKFVSWMRSGSGSFLVQDSVGREWVVKSYNNPQGSRLLCNEITGSVLLRAVGLPSLPWRRIRLDRDLVEMLQDSDRQVQPGDFATEQFASLFVGGTNYATFPLACVPEDESWIKDLLGLYVFDVWAAHRDQRELFSTLDKSTSHVSLLTIDNGHLFFGPEAGPQVTLDVRQRLCEPLRTLVIRDSSLPLLEWWIEHLRFVLPAFIDHELQQSGQTWGQNELLSSPDRFRARLLSLEDLVFADRKDQTF